MAAPRQRLLSEDDIADLLAEGETLRERVADLLDVCHAHERIIRELRATVARNATVGAAPVSRVDPDSAEQ